MVQTLKRTKKELLQDTFGAEWYELLEPFLISSDFERILNGLKLDMERGRIITPRFKDIFNCFRKCPLPLLNTIILSDAPYSGTLPTGEPIADGLAFSAAYSAKCPAALERIYEAIDDSIYKRENYNLTDTNDLSRWARQGILLLNTSLTTTIGEANDHCDLWKPFTKYVLQKINIHCDHLGVIALGRYGMEASTHLMNKTYYKVKTSHPNYAQHTGASWQHNDCFKTIDAFQEHTNNLTIQW